MLTGAMTPVAHACPSCGFVAARKVWVHADGSFRPHLCTACAMLDSARTHEAAARKLRAKAEQIFERRKKKT